MKNLKLAIPLILLVIGFAIYGIMYVSYTNKEIKLAENIHAKQDVTSASFDNMWKILTTQAGEATEYKESFKDVYTEIMAGRYSNERGGALMSWIHESNPEFDASIYTKLMTSIQAERTSFFKEQKMLVDLNREHKTIRQTIPGKWFIGNKEDIEIIIIESDKTKEAYNTGLENDVDLFNKK